MEWFLIDIKNLWLIIKKKFIIFKIKVDFVYGILNWGVNDYLSGI